jgi:hypothetical protein
MGRHTTDNHLWFGPQSIALISDHVVWDDESSQQGAVF